MPVLLRFDRVRVRRKGSSEDEEISGAIDFNTFDSTVFELTDPATKTGRRADGVASCSNREPNKTSATAHVIYATAYTRAANRAIADLVAAGEVSAEEVE